MNIPVRVQKEIGTSLAVIGGGLAGCAAAIRAAREGADVILVESGGELGGDITKGIIPNMLDIDGKGGIVREIMDEMNAQSRTCPRKGVRFDENGKLLPGALIDLETLKLVLEGKCLDAGVTILYHSILAEVCMENDRICAVLLATEGGTVLVKAGCFVDATGNGALAGLCGCEYEFGCPDNGHPQPSTVSLIVTGIGENVRPTDNNAEKKALRDALIEAGITPSSEGVMLVRLPQEGTWNLVFHNAYDLAPDDVFALSAATSGGRREYTEALPKLRKISGFENLEILDVSSHIGVREGRRVRGVYRLSFADITEGRKFADGICTAEFPIDVHSVTDGDKTDHKKGKKVMAYHIPFRSLLPLGVKNLLLAGRCISGDFYAHASYRVAGNVLSMGEAAGYAAAKALSENRVPDEKDGEEVSRFMKALGYRV